MSAKPTTTQREFARAVFKHNARPFGHIRPLWTEAFPGDIWPHLGCSYGIVTGRPELYAGAPLLEAFNREGSCYVAKLADVLPEADGEKHRLTEMWERLEASERRPLLLTRYLADIEESSSSAPYHIPLTPYRVLRPEEGPDEVWVSAVLLGLVSNDPHTLFADYRYEQALDSTHAVRVLRVSRWQGREVLTSVAWLMPVMGAHVSMVQPTR